MKMYQGFYTHSSALLWGVEQAIVESFCSAYMMIQLHAEISFLYSVYIRKTIFYEMVMRLGRNAAGLLGFQVFGLSEH